MKAYGSDERAAPVEENSDKYLVHVETSSLHDGMELERATWEPLYGGEMNTLWDKILTQPGDEVYIKGSTVLKLAFDAYIVDKTTGLADAELRSDTDVVVFSPEILERAKSAFALDFGSNKVGARSKLGDLSIDIISAALVKEEDAKGMLELEQWAIKEGKTPEFIERIQSTIAKMNQASPRETLELDHLLPSSSMAVRLRRNDDGSLSAFLEDCAGMLNMPDVQVSLAQRNRPNSFVDRTQEESSMYEVAFTNSNRDSIPALYLEAFSDPSLHEYTSNYYEPIFAIRPLAIMIKDSCELGVTFVGQGQVDFPDSYAEYYAVARRIVSNDLKVTATSAQGEEVDAREVLKSKVQFFFARGCASNLHTAAQWVLADMPYAGLISEDLGIIFEEYGEKVPPNNIVLSEIGLEATLTSRDKVMPYAKAVTLPRDFPNGVEIPNIQATRAFLRYGRMVNAFYDYDIRFREVEALGSKDGGRDTFLADTAAYPNGMSEVMAMILTSVEWDPDKDTQKIDQLIANWQPKGKLDLGWKRDNFEWDMGLDKDTIIRYMRKFKEAQ
jgi:hypothetical protein